MMTAINEDNLFAVIVKSSIFFLVILVLAGWIFFSSQFALGSLAGGLIAITNIFWLRNVLKQILEQLPAKAVIIAQFKYLSRLTVTAVALYFIVVSKYFSLAGLFTGLSVVVLSIIALSLYSALRTGG